MTTEFDIIKKYFSFSNNQDVCLAVGDDAAVLQVNAAKLVVATDTIIENVHFPLGMAAEHVASRALGVNLSDFAAMGAKPRWFTLALTLPEFNAHWLESFSAKMVSLCERYDIALVGGDTTRGALSVTLTVMGTTNEQDNGASYLTRAGAQAGDDIWLSGALGKGAAALALLQGSVDVNQWPIDKSEKNALLETFYAPNPCLELGVSLCGIASSAIDISDGLLADANHIAVQSKVCLAFNLKSLPVYQSLKQHADRKKIMQWVLSGGDEYELLFTAPPTCKDKIQLLAAKINLPCSLVGSVYHGVGIKIDGKMVEPLDKKGYSHF